MLLGMKKLKRSTLTLLVTEMISIDWNDRIPLGPIIITNRDTCNWELGYLIFSTKYLIN